MKTWMVTGATGLLGSRVCERLIARGDNVRGLVRNRQSNDAKALARIGVELVAGDVGDMEVVQAATDGCDAVVHSAAMLGRPGASVEIGYNANVIGTLNVLSAAFLAGGIPVMQVLTTTFFDMWGKSLTEHSPLDLAARNRDVYSITKRLGYVEGLARVAEGQDIRFMMPGAIYGPSICIDNATIKPSFNDRLASAIRGEMAPQIPIPVPYSLADDCAYVCIAGLEKGRSGERYIAHGRKEDVGSIAAICNQACEIAGVAHRVDEVPKERLDDPEIVAQYGTTMTGLGKRKYPQPFSDSRFTQERLGYVPTPLREGLIETVAWMRQQKII